METGTQDLMSFRKSPDLVLIQKTEGIPSRVVDLIDFLSLFVGNETIVCKRNDIKKYLEHQRWVIFKVWHKSIF